jgi:hypothetical protein
VVPDGLPAAATTVPRTPGGAQARLAIATPAWVLMTWPPLVTEFTSVPVPFHVAV